MRTELPFGTGTVAVELPDDRVVSPDTGVSTPLPVAPDLGAEVQRALTQPVDTPPLRELARGKRSAVIAFDDPTVPQWAPMWSVAIPAVLAELEAGGIPSDRVQLLCANALHRKFTHDELAGILGSDLVAGFADRLGCHDAEDPEGLIHVGTTEHGYHVDLNRAAAETDLLVYVNCSTIRGFSGGWKSVCVGLSTFRSIRAHHNPDDMSMSLNRNRMHEMLDEMGALVNRELGPQHVFKLECVQANPLEVSRVFGGTVDGTRREAKALMKAHQPDRRSLIDEPVDIVVYGVPEWSPYAAFASMNPILTLVSTGLGYLGGVIEAFGAPGCTVIMATPCPPTWDEVHHPSYREVWDRVLPETLDPYEIQSRYEDDFASNPGYIEAYRNGNAFHGVHGIMATFPLKRLRHAGRVSIAGAEDPSVPEHLGFGAYPTVEDAIGAAEAVHGPDARIACVRYPPAFNRT